MAAELEKRLRADLREMGDFRRVHALPHSGQDVPDDMDARLVVLGPEHPYSKQPGCAAEAAAKAILASRGSAPRIFQNSLVFLAVDQTRLQDLDEAIRRFLAWESILLEKNELDLSPHQVKQAETQKGSADGAVKGRVPETYQWLLVPVQESPKKSLEWQASRLSGQEPLAVRTSRKLKNDGRLLTVLAGTVLRMELDKVPLWRGDGDHVPVSQLTEDFARYLYLPRLTGPSVPSRAVSDGVSLLTWEQDAFACADSYDESEARYRGLRSGQNIALEGEGASGLLVHPAAARLQLDEEMPGAKPAGAAGPEPVATGVGPDVPTGPGEASEPPRARRFHGSVELDAARVGRCPGADPIALVVLVRGREQHHHPLSVSASWLAPTTWGRVAESSNISNRLDMNLQTRRLSTRVGALDFLLTQIVVALQLTDTHVARMESAYRALAAWLEHPDCPLAAYGPILVYPQGSAAIGTTVRPLLWAEFDLDFVIEVAFFAGTPMELYDLVVERLQQHRTYAKMLERKRRCVRILYEDGFHADVLGSRTAVRVVIPGSIEIPDRDTPTLWRDSNPRGFAQWFVARSREATESRFLAKAPPLPSDWAAEAKTVLQRIVQLAKRGRDVAFGDRDAASPTET